MSENAKVWVFHLLSLTKVTNKKPKAVYTALTKSFQYKWTFFSVLFVVVTVLC